VVSRTSSTARMDIGQINLKMMQPLYGYKKKDPRGNARPENTP